MRSKSQQLGFTLTEVLIVLAIIGFLVVIFIDFFLQYNRSFSFLSATVDTAESAGMVMNKISEAVRQASRVVGSRSFSGTVYASDADTLVLELPAMDSSGAIAGEFDYMVFYLEGGKIFWRTEADPASQRATGVKQLSDTVQSFNLVYDQADVSLATKVDVDVQTQKQTRGQLAQSHLHQIIYLRNKL